MEEAERLADRIVIIDRGVVLAMGTPAQLMTAGAGHEIRFGGPHGLPVGELGEALGAVVTEDQPGEYRVGTEPTPTAVAALTAWLAARDLPLSDLRAGRHRLEDVFLRLTSASSSSPPAHDRTRRGS
jgi:ABC-2 type transport system ATP-binding protein